MVDEKANEAAAEFLRAHIRSVVTDPATAERLCPKGYPLGAKRPPIEHGYCAAFTGTRTEDDVRRAYADPPGTDGLERRLIDWALSGRPRAGAPNCARYDDGRNGAGLTASD